MKRQKGFSVVEVLLVGLVVVIIGAIGYLAYTNLWVPKANETASTVAATPVKVTSKKDLDTVSSDLDQLSVDDNELKQLDSATNSF